MANLVNADRVRLAFGTRTLLADVSLGLGVGEVIGVVGRNGAGKTTLLRVLAGAQPVDSGAVTRTNSLSLGALWQSDDMPAGVTVRDVVVGGRPDHAWAAAAQSRAIVTELLADVPLDSPITALSGGERRRAALAAMLLPRHDLLILDEPTNHLDVEAVSWLAAELKRRSDTGQAMLIVSHDRWFLDEICTRMWEVHDGEVDAYDGGYSAYVLARTERARQAAAAETRRRNLLRKELAWLRRGPPARTSKPQFRIATANALIADVPPPRDRLQLQQFSVSRLGKDVFDLHALTHTLPTGRDLLRNVDWSIGPGDRIGLIGVNGAGKTTLLNLLAGTVKPTSGKVKRGRTLRLSMLTQSVGELDDGERVLDSVTTLARRTRLATGRELPASQLLEDFGFTGEKLVTRIGDLSGGERRRLQFLRLLLSEPNVLLLDEPTNDLDIDTLTVVEDHLDTWPGTLLVVSHDRYFLERTCDVVYALLGDGSVGLLPGGVDEYLDRRRAARAADAAQPTATGSAAPTAAAEHRRLKKELAKLEGQLAKADKAIARVHDQMAAAAADFVRLGELQTELDRLETGKDELETAWLEAATALES